MFSVCGYVIIDVFAKAAQQVGTNRSTDSFSKAMDTMRIDPDMYGSAKITYTATKRLGDDLSRLSQITDGRWKVMSGYIKPCERALKACASTLQAAGGLQADFWSGRIIAP